MGKKLDFASYGIDVKFQRRALKLLAESAARENTGARGLVSAVERALLPFEKRLPSTDTTTLPVTETLIKNPMEALRRLASREAAADSEETFQALVADERSAIRDYLRTNAKTLSEKHGLTLTASRVDMVAAYYTMHALEIGKVIRKIKSYYDDIKKIELYFYKSNDINIVLEEGAIDFIIEKMVVSGTELKAFYRQLSADFELGLKLVREKTGRSRFFITREALLDPETFISNLIRDELSFLPEE